VEPGSFTATRAKNEFGRVLEQATRDGIVVVTRHDRPAAVVLPIEEFEDLASYRERELEALRGEFDALLARMQTPRGRRGVKAAFAATPERMGAAARAAARRG
jgi:prevent-host-death family protein